MRFYHKEPYKPQGGDRRVVRRFLWFPKRIAFETRWLEIAEWEERYWCSYGDSDWVPENWVDKKSIKN